MSLHADILSLLQGEKPASPPAFSGLIHITSECLEANGLVFHEIHKDASKMAQGAASTFMRTGMPSATLPLDLCAPAEALGAALNYNEGGDHRFPQVGNPLFNSTGYLNGAFFKSGDFIQRGRLPLINLAIRQLKENVGDQVAISGMLPGPYTLLLYLVDPGSLFAEMKREPKSVLDALLHLSSFLSRIGIAYRESGADYITVHEMGGSPGFIGPVKFEQFVLPALQKLHADLPGPRVLSVCGNANKSLGALAESGAEAISVDQLTDLRAAREALKDVLLFGNIDPVAILLQGDKAQVVEAVSGAKGAGVDAIWPGCDLAPAMPIENLMAFIDS